MRCYLFSSVITVNAVNVVVVFRAQYENQVNILGSWTNKGPTMTRPKWSDESGKVYCWALIYRINITTAYHKC